MVHLATTRYAVLSLHQIILFLFILYNRKPETFSNCQTEEMRTCTQSVLHVNSPCVLCCVHKPVIALSCAHSIFYSPDVSAERWVGGSFCPLRSLRCFRSPTHPPLHKNTTRYPFLLLAIPPALTGWGLESPPSLMRKKRWFCAILNFMCFDVLFICSDVSDVHLTRPNFACMINFCFG